MKRFIEQQERSQVTLFPERLDDYVNEDNPVRVVDVFVESLHLATLGFEGAMPAKTGRRNMVQVVPCQSSRQFLTNRLWSLLAAKTVFIG
ncbi:hypothetical protein SAMN06295970_1308 [Noviherbaspirillum suwonense]|uniref:Transposase n=1 Tax=Noviherbaspirillum suwonense TaxID=1224511 RepID=A0ABY1QS57_9BURK|nr:hypothetical protein SAMN06295970_1308 [Noviherbaspirillum suwonense]